MSGPSSLTEKEQWCKMKSGVLGPAGAWVQIYYGGVLVQPLDREGEGGLLFVIQGYLKLFLFFLFG